MSQKLSPVAHKLKSKLGDDTTHFTMVRTPPRNHGKPWTHAGYRAISQKFCLEKKVYEKRSGISCNPSAYRSDLKIHDANLTTRPPPIRKI